MASLVQLERQVVELRALVRARIGAPTELLVICRGDQFDADAEREALEQVPARYRREVRLHWLRLPWLKGRKIAAAALFVSGSAVQVGQVTDSTGARTAVSGQGAAETLDLTSLSASPDMSPDGSPAAVPGDAEAPVHQTHHELAGTAASVVAADASPERESAAASPSGADTTPQRRAGGRRPKKSAPTPTPASPGGGGGVSEMEPPPSAAILKNSTPDF